MGFINGNLEILSVKIEGAYLPIGCLTSNSFSESAEMLNTTTRDNAGWKTSIPVMQSFGANFSGLIKLYDEDWGSVDYFALRELKRTRTLLDFQVIRQNGYKDVFQGYLTNLSDSASVDEMISFEGEVQGYGKPRTILPSKSFNIDSYEYDSVNRIFSVYPDDTMYFSGNGTEPEIGDSIFLDDESENIFDGKNKYYGINDETWIQVDENGIVIDKGLILDEVPFIMEIIIPNDGDAFKLESVGNSVWKVQGGQDAVVDWGDGTTSQLDDSNVGGNSFGVEKSYSASGTYQVKISGRLTALTVTDTGDKIIKISQWGDLGLLRYALKLGNLTELPQGAITGFYGTKRGSKYNDEPISETTPDTFQINLYDTYSIEYLPNNFLNFLKFEDIGYGVFMGIFYQNCYKLKNIPEDFFQGVLVATGSNYLFQDCYDLEYLPPDLLNNSYGFKQDISRFFMSNAGRNYLGDPSKTLVLDENFFSNVNLGNKTNFGFTLIGWNIDNVPKNLFKNSLGSIANGGDGVLQVYPLFYNCTKLTELPDDLFKDFQLSKDMASSIRNTSITHVKSSWLGGTVQNNDISFRDFARGGIVDTIDEDFFDYFPNTIDLRLAFADNEIVTFPNNTFRDLPKVTTFAQTFSNNPLVSIPQDAFKESVNVSTLSSMFANTNITNVPSDLFKDFTEVVYAGGIFFQCYQLSDIPVGFFDDMTKNNSFYRTFYRCNSLTLIPNNLFDNNQEFCDFRGVFEECNSLVTVPDLLFQNTKPTNIESIFKGCSSLKTISLDIFNVISDKTQIKEVFNAFEESGLEISVTKDMFEGFTLPNNTRNIESVFAETKIKYVCKELFQDIPLITNIFRLFRDCQELTTIEDGFLQNQITQITTTAEAFNNCIKLANFDAYSWGKNLPNQLVNARLFMSRNSVQTGVLPRLWFNRPLPSNQYYSAFEYCNNAPNYPEVPLDWGGEIGSSRLGFYIDTYKYDSVGKMFTTSPTTWLVHDGDEENPNIGDTVYLDYDLSSNIFDGDDKYFAINHDLTNPTEATHWIQVGDNGLIIDKGAISTDDEFIMEVEIPTDNFEFVFGASIQNTGIPEKQFTNAFVDYGDGTIDNWTHANYNNTTPPPLHTYAISGTYQIKISGRLTDIRINGGDTASSVRKIIQWGDLGVYGYYISFCRNMTSVPDGAITGFANSNRGTKFNKEYEDSTLDLYFREIKSLEELPTGFTEFIKYEDTGFTFSYQDSWSMGHKIKTIPDDWFSGLRINGATSMLRDYYDLEYLPPNLLNNAYEWIGSAYGYYTFDNLGKNYLGDPNKTLVLDENFFSKMPMIEAEGTGIFRLNTLFSGCNFAEIPKNIFHNSPSSIQNGGSGKINLSGGAFRGCTKLTELPDDILKDWQVVTSMKEFIGTTSITHVKSSWFGGTVQQNDIDCESFADSSLVDTIDEDFFTFIPNTTDLKEAFENTELVSFPNNTFRNLPKVTSYEQCFSNTPLASVPTDAFKESVNVTSLYTMFGQTDITSIPANLFKDFTEVTNASRIFYICSNLTAIPNGLFDSMTKNENFAQIFYRCVLITSVPNNLFDNNTEVTDFSRAFRECYALESVDEDLLVNNLKTKSVSSMFRGCRMLPTFVKINHLSLLEDAADCFNQLGGSSDQVVEIPHDLIQGLSNLTNIARMLYQANNVVDNSGSPSGAHKLPNTFFDGCTSLVYLEGLWSNGNVFIELEGLTLPTTVINIAGFIWNDGGQRGEPLYQDIPNILEGNTNSLIVDVLCWRTNYVTGFIYRYWLDENLSFSSTRDAFNRLPNALNYLEIPTSWGGTNDGSVTRLGFYIDENGYTDSNSVQNGGETSWLVHNGANEEPSVGDTIYQDYEPSTSVFNGLDKYYAIKGVKWIQISSSGVVLSKGDSSAPSLGLEVLTFALASRFSQGVNLVVDRTEGQGVVTQQISYRQTGTTTFSLGASTTERLTIMTQTGLISGQSYDFQLTLIDDNETVVSNIITVSIQ